MLAALLALLMLVAAGCDGNEEATPPPETTGPGATPLSRRPSRRPPLRDGVMPRSQDGRVHTRGRRAALRGADDRPDR